MNWYLKCFRQYVDFSSRARRKEYWSFALFNVIISVLLSLIDGMLGWTSPNLEFGLLGSIYYLAVMLPGIAVSVRRLHDIGKSGWNFFVCFIPIIGAILFIVWTCMEGENGNNQWGPNPKD